MKAILGEIQSGEFAKEWITEYKCGMPHFSELRQEGAHHPIEKVGAAIRSLIPCLGSR
jgi:ketol-acid reductoisomerase